MKAATLADAPECGCTLAKPAPNSFLTRSIASVLGDVDVLAAAVVAPARQALGVLVGQHRALRLQHGAADDVLGRDQLDLVALAAELEPDRLGDLGIGVGQRGGEQRIRDGFRGGFGHGHCGSPGMVWPSISAPIRQGLAWPPLTARNMLSLRLSSRSSRALSFCSASCSRSDWAALARTHDRNLDAGQAVDGDDLHRIADHDELEIDLAVFGLGHGCGLWRRQASTTT